MNQQDLKPPKVGRPDGLAKSLKGAPDDVRLGVWMWLSVASMQAMYALVQFVANIVDPRALKTQLKQQSEGMGGTSGLLAGEDITAHATSVNVTMLLTMLLICALCAFLTMRAGRGGPYSRMFLNVGSVYLALQAVLLLFGGSPSTMPVEFVLLLGILSILSGVAGVLGIWFMSRPENREWLGVPDAAEVEKYAEAVERRRKEERDAKKARKEAKEREAKERENNNDPRNQGPHNPGPYNQGPHNNGQQNNGPGNHDPRNQYRR